MRSAEQNKEARHLCDPCRTDKELGIQKPHDCPACGKKVNNFNDPEREEKLKIIVEQKRRRIEADKRKQEEERKRIEAELAGEEVEHDTNGQEG